jgi:hypothetical protein
MTRVRKPARSLETALDIVETGIKKIVTSLRPPVPDEKPNARRVSRTKAQPRVA